MEYTHCGSLDWIFKKVGLVNITVVVRVAKGGSGEFDGPIERLTQD